MGLIRVFKVVVGHHDGGCWQWSWLPPGACGTSCRGWSSASSPPQAPRAARGGRAAPAPGPTSHPTLDSLRGLTTCTTWTTCTRPGHYGGTWPRSSWRAAATPHPQLSPPSSWCRCPAGPGLDKMVIIVIAHHGKFEFLTRDGRSRCRDPRYRDFCGLGTGLGTSET